MKLSGNPQEGGRNGARTPFVPRNNRHGSAAGRSNFSSPVLDGFGKNDFCSPRVEQGKSVYVGNSAQGRCFGGLGVVSPSYRPPHTFVAGRANDAYSQQSFLPSQRYMSPSPLFMQSDASSPPSTYPKPRLAVRPSVSRGALDESAEWGSSVYEGTERSGRVLPTKTTVLPAWTLDPITQRVSISLSEILQHGLLTTFATDRMGCHHLQDLYPPENSVDRQQIVDEVLDNKEVFEKLCGSVFGNFFMQSMIEKATDEEMNRISEHLTGNMFEMCLNRYSCRVVQKAIEHLPANLNSGLLLELHHSDLVRLSVDQNANHVIQKIMSCCPLSDWTFLVNFFFDDVNALLAVAEDKYGCRVIQLSIQLLAEEKKRNVVAAQLLDKIFYHLVHKCERMATNEFANYVIQHVIKDEELAAYRDTIIQKCILGNILSMSQERFASHVVEVAIQFAPTLLLKELMDEIFDGYLPHPDTNNNAIDIMIFHRYGNYVVQRMLIVCVEAIQQYRQGKIVSHIDLFEDWLGKLEKRVQFHRSRLMRYSSGKRILEILDSVAPNFQHVVPPPSRVIRHSSNKPRAPMNNCHFN